MKQISIFYSDSSLTLKKVAAMMSKTIIDLEEGVVSQVTAQLLAKVVAVLGRRAGTAPVAAPISYTGQSK